jgi:hypothetical protein
VAGPEFKLVVIWQILLFGFFGWNFQPGLRSGCNGVMGVKETSDQGLG